MRPPQRPAAGVSALGRSLSGGSGTGRSGAALPPLPEGRAGRALAVGAALLLLLLLWEAIGSPLTGWYHDRAQALAGQDALERRMQGLAVQLPALRREAAAAPHAGPVPLIQGASDALASAALQEQVQQMATGLGATLSSTENLPASQAGAYRRVGVRISITAPFEVMVRLIAAIEQATPAMLIDDLQMHGSRILMQTSSPLEGSMTILAFRSGEADRAGPPGDPDAGPGIGQGAGRGPGFGPGGDAPDEAPP